MRQRQLLRDHERRARDALRLDAEPRGESFDEARLARAERTRAAARSRPRRRSQPPSAAPQALGRFRARGMQRKLALDRVRRRPVAQRGGHRGQLEPRARCASRPASPRRARSGRPRRRARRRRAPPRRSAGRPCASSPVTMPSSTSPVPPLASAGPPVGFTTARRPARPSRSRRPSAAPRHRSSARAAARARRGRG